MIEPEQGDALDARLENWGAVLSGRLAGGRGGATESLEGLYRAPRFSAALGAPSVAVELDQDDAQVIESAVILLPLFHHALLRCWHVHRLAPGTCIDRARRVGGPGSPEGRHLPAHLDRAKALLEAALRVPAVIRKERARDYVRRMLATGGGEMGTLDKPDAIG